MRSRFMILLIAVIALLLVLCGCQSYSPEETDQEEVNKEEDADTTAAPDDTIAEDGDILSDDASDFVL